MKTYSCQNCETEIKPLVCAKCDTELANKSVEKNGKKVQVAECPKCHGMVKAPQCCDATMKYS